MGKLTAKQRLTEQRPTGFRQAARACLLLGPDFHAPLKLSGPEQRFHKDSLIDTAWQEKHAEIDQARLGQIASNVEIATTRLVRRLQWFHGRWRRQSAAFLAGQMTIISIKYLNSIH